MLARLMATYPLPNAASNVKRPTARIAIAAMSSTSKKPSCARRRLWMRSVRGAIGAAEAVGQGRAERSADDEREVREAPVQLLTNRHRPGCDERPLGRAIATAGGDRSRAIDPTLEAQ